MRKILKMTLKEQYELACNNYVLQFSRKHEIEFDGWIGEHVGGLASFIQEYFFSMSDII